MKLKTRERNGICRCAPLLSSVFVFMTMTATATASARARVRLLFCIARAAVRTANALLATLFRFDDVCHSTANDQSDQNQYDNISKRHTFSLKRLPFLFWQLPSAHILPSAACSFLQSKRQQWQRSPLQLPSLRSASKSRQSFHP